MRPSIGLPDFSISLSWIILGTEGPACSKPDQANLGLARILILVLKLFGKVFSLLRMVSTMAYTIEYLDTRRRLLSPKEA